MTEAAPRNRSAGDPDGWRTGGTLAPNVARKPELANSMTPPGLPLPPE